jgi:ribosome-binding protein aMBF1 (putative translation factor)
MTQKTCAACDYKLEGEIITVKVGGRTVEVCCEECAEKLREAHVATAEKKKA